MDSNTLKQTLAVAAVTGMRSMAGPAILALHYPGVMKTVVPLLAAGEMLLDKTELVGDRVDAVPLTGRALMGAVVGGVIAHQHRQDVLLGSLIGAATAVIFAHVAYHVRTRLPLPSAMGGVLEDLAVIGMAKAFSGRADRAGAAVSSLAAVPDAASPIP